MPADTKEIASLDATNCIVEKVNNVDYLERFGKHILPPQMRDTFRKSRKDGFGSYFVQAPVGPLCEAITHANHLAKGREDALSLKQKAVLLLLYVTPMPPELLSKRPKTVYHHSGFLVDAIASSSSVSSPLQSGVLGTTHLLLPHAIMEELHSEHRISMETKADQEEYADFIASDTKNACDKFGGKLNQIRFHPIMANLAMNMYIGMAYKDTMVDVLPFCFPTMRTMQ